MEQHALTRPARTPIVSPGGIDLHEQDMTAAFSADVTLDAAQQRLAQIGQWLPIDGNSESTLGELLDQNSTGALRLGYGAWRDLLLGAQFRNGRGELITAGGRTVKNVAGYDLTKFMVGQHGQFGRLVTLTTRTYRRPAGAIALHLPPDPARINLLLPSPLRPQWALLTAEGLHLGYLADERTLEFYNRQLPTLSPTTMVAQSVDDDITMRHSLWCAFGEPSFRATVPPVKVLEFAAKAGVSAWTADASFGIVVGAVAAQRRALCAAADAVGGKVMFSDEARPPMTGAEAALVDRLKTAFGAPVPSPGTPRVGYGEGSIEGYRQR